VANVFDGIFAAINSPDVGAACEEQREVRDTLTSYDLELVDSAFSGLKEIWVVFRLALEKNKSPIVQQALSDVARTSQANPEDVSAFEKKLGFVNKVALFMLKVNERFANRTGLLGTNGATMAEVDRVDGLVPDDFDSLELFNAQLVESLAGITALGRAAPGSADFPNNYARRLGKSTDAKIVAAGRLVTAHTRQVIADGRSLGHSSADVERIIGSTPRAHLEFVERFIASRDVVPTAEDKRIAKANKDARIILANGRSTYPAAPASGRSRGAAAEAPEEFTQAYGAQGKGGKGGRGRRGGGGGGKAAGKGNRDGAKGAPNATALTSFKGKCFKCGEQGHISSVCPRNKSRQQDGQRSNGGQGASQQQQHQHFANQAAPVPAPVPSSTASGAAPSPTATGTPHAQGAYGAYGGQALPWQMWWPMMHWPQHMGGAYQMPFVGSAQASGGGSSSSSTNPVGNALVVHQQTPSSSVGALPSGVRL
jgi:hypothetical protein